MSVTRGTEIKLYSDHYQPAIQRARNVLAQIKAARQSAADADAQWDGFESAMLAAGATQQEIDDEFRADFQAEAGAIFQQASAELIALMTTVSVISGVTAKAALQGMSDAAPDTIPQD